MKSVFEPTTGVENGQLHFVELDRAWFTIRSNLGRRQCSGEALDCGVVAVESYSDTKQEFGT